ncbi:MAG: alpha/beta fold hydrolase [Gemmatimonadota bacterium]
MPLIAAAGRAFHVQRLGSGSPVVLIHGLVIGNLATWFFGVAPRLARRRSVLLYDQRGHGLSAPADSGFDLATSSADLAGLLAAVGGFDGSVDVVGHSYGGAVALRLAMDEPGRVRRIVVLDAPLPPFDPAEVAAMMKEVDAEQLERLLALDHQQFSDLASKLAVGRGRRGARRADRARHLREGTTVTADLMAEPPLDPDRLAALDRPVLCVYGSTSPFRGRADDLAAALPDARVVELAGGHLLPLECPAEVVRVVEEFLDG